MASYNGMSNLYNASGNAAPNATFFPSFYSSINSRIYNSKTIYQTYEVTPVESGARSIVFFSTPIHFRKQPDSTYTKGSIHFARCLIQFINIGTDNLQAADINFTVELLVRFKYFFITPTPNNPLTKIGVTHEKNMLFPTNLPGGYNSTSLFNFGGSFPLLTPEIVSEVIDTDVNGINTFRDSFTIKNTFSFPDHYYIKTFVELR